VDDCDRKIHVGEVWESREAPGQEPGPSVDERLAVVRRQLVGPAVPDRSRVLVVPAEWLLQQRWSCLKLRSSSYGRPWPQELRKLNTVDGHPRDLAESILRQEQRAAADGQGDVTGVLTFDNRALRLTVRLHSKTSLLLALSSLVLLPL